MPNTLKVILVDLCTKMILLNRLKDYLTSVKVSQDSENLILTMMVFLRFFMGCSTGEETWS